jgi:predicted transposase YdaD
MSELAEKRYWQMPAARYWQMVETINRLDRRQEIFDAREEGIEIGNKSVARAMLKRKMPFDVVSEITGLSLDEIKQL